MRSPHDRIFRAGWQLTAIALLLTAISFAFAPARGASAAPDGCGRLVNDLRAAITSGQALASPSAELLRDCASGTRAASGPAVAPAAEDVYIRFQTSGTCVALSSFPISAGVPFVVGTFATGPGLAFGFGLWIGPGGLFVGFNPVSNPHLVVEGFIMSMEPCL